MRFHTKSRVCFSCSARITCLSNFLNKLKLIICHHVWISLIFSKFSTLNFNLLLVFFNFTFTKDKLYNFIIPSNLQLDEKCFLKFFKGKWKQLCTMLNCIFAIGVYALCIIA